MNLRLLCLISALALLGGCLPPDTSIKLGVPYVAQEQYNYCTAASVLMWRYYDGLSPLSQQYIFNAEGGTGNTNQIAVRDAVNRYTNTHDAYWDNGGAGAYRAMAARQITTIDQGVPGIIVIRSDHTVVIDGGKWHDDGTSKVWDYVYFNDPDPDFGGKDVYAGAGNWLDLFCPTYAYSCDQILSSSATLAWQSNFDTYDSEVSVYGGTHSKTGPLPY